MTLCRLILPSWAHEIDVSKRKVLEGLFSDEEIKSYNAQGYNIYYFPNYPSNYKKGVVVDGSHIDVFSYVFVDCDLKDGDWASKDQFIEAVGCANLPPSKIIDSGNGIHVYWQVSNLDPMSYLRFQRRLQKLLVTDEAVGQLLQLMRLPNTINTKLQNNQVLCEVLLESDVKYTPEDLDKALPSITTEDEQYCKHHYDKTYRINQSNIEISDVLPAKFGRLLKDNHEAKTLWAEPTDDRSKADYRLGHLMFANGFTKPEALSVLVNSAKALQRAPVHRVSYAENIVDKIWTFEQGDVKEKAELSMSVKEILQRQGDAIKGTPFRCHPRIDNTNRGFRLGDVIGLVGGSGIGKTALALNMFQWFAELNPDYHSLFVPLEQPANEIAAHWETMCGDNTALHEKVHIMSNYDEVGNFRHLSFSEIKDYVEHFQKTTGNKIGCVVIDHIGALKKKGKDGENQDIMDICHAMKAFAIQTKTVLIMQSQTSREKAGIGDLELNKDAAYGSVYFESYCDYLLTLWQPLKRCAAEPDCPLVTAFKFCKIRHKKPKLDIIKEDVLYYMYFDSETERMRDMTQQEKDAFKYFLPIATNKRKSDRKTDILPYTSVPYLGENEATTNNNQVSARSS